MEENVSQKIRKLCEQAAQEQDATRLMELVKEIVDTFDAQPSQRKKDLVTGTSSRQ